MEIQPILNCPLDIRLKIFVLHNFKKKMIFRSQNDYYKQIQFDILLIFLKSTNICNRNG